MNNTKSHIILYKYRDWSINNHKKILLDNELYMAPPSSFNDPFDCRIPENYFLLDNEEKLNLFIDKIEKKYKDRLTNLNYDNEIVKANYKKRFSDLKLTQKSHEEHFFQQTNKCYGILSLTTKFDSLLMWSHYGNEHKGFCIGFNEDKMRESGLFGAGFEVKYDVEFPIRNPLEDREPMDDAYLQLGHKAIEWEYENEFRLINLKLDGLNDIDRKINFPNNFISEIILGANISDIHKNEIIKIAKERKIKMKQLYKEPFKFNLKIKEI
jgi:hypothetical protein